MEALITYDVDQLKTFELFTHGILYFLDVRRGVAFSRGRIGQER
jgi:hypothetical protein